MNDFNEIVCTGRVSRDADVRMTPNGKKVAKVGLAINRSWNASGNYDNPDWKNEAFFVDVVGWGFTANKIEKSASKGERVLVSGRLSVRDYNASDGSKRRAVEIIANTFEVLENSPHSENSNNSSAEDILKDFDVPSENNQNLGSEDSVQEKEEEDATSTDTSVPFN